MTAIEFEEYVEHMLYCDSWTKKRSGELLRMPAREFNMVVKALHADRKRLYLEVCYAHRKKA